MSLSSRSAYLLNVTQIAKCAQVFGTRSDYSSYLRNYMALQTVLEHVQSMLELQLTSIQTILNCRLGSLSLAYSKYSCPLDIIKHSSSTIRIVFGIHSNHV